MHKAVVRQFSRYLYHVMKNIGNSYVTKRSTDEAGVVYTEVPKKRVKGVVDYVGRQLFDAPLWLYPASITSRIATKSMDDIVEQQNQMLNMFLSQGLIYNISQKALNSADPYPVKEYLNDLKNTTWIKFSGVEASDVFRRSLQRSYLEKLNMLINPKDIADGKAMTTAQRSDVRLEAITHLNDIKETIKLLVPQTSGINQLHLKDMLLEIEKITKKSNSNA
ncbi:hypothetical protein D3C73_1156520 [compost metagenome]